VLLGTSLCVWKYEVKHDFLNQLSVENLIEISKQSDHRLLDNGLEIEQNGLRYDVVQVSDNAYFCWLDTKENSILSSLFNTVIEKESKHNVNHFSILKDIFKIYIIDNQYFKYFYFNKITIINVFNILELSPTYISTFLIPPIGLNRLKAPCH
jgi:hypothetical protein